MCPVLLNAWTWSAIPLYNNHFRVDQFSASFMFYLNYLARNETLSIEIWNITGLRKQSNTDAHDKDVQDSKKHTEEVSCSTFSDGLNNSIQLM